LAIIFTYNLTSRFRQLKEEENRRKLSKALAAGDSDASSSTYDMEDEELDDETTEEVLFTLFSIIIAGHSEASHIEKHSLSLQLLKNVKFILCYSCKILTAGRTCGGSIQYWQ
jgi:hypothetical protein